jgi:hypothetical protein
MSAFRAATVRERSPASRTDLTLPDGRGSNWSTPTLGFSQLAGICVKLPLPRRTPSAPNGERQRAAAVPWDLGWKDKDARSLAGDC